MRKSIMIVSIFFSFAFGYLQVNDVVGKSIDANEARYYRIFADVPGFESARFTENGDSVLVEVNKMINGIHETQYRNIDKRTYISLNQFIIYYNLIVFDKSIRAEFTRKNIIGWPLVTRHEIDNVVSEYNKMKNLNTAFCMSGIIPGSAYAGALLGREVLDQGGWGFCIGGPYNLVRINPNTYCLVTAGGTGTGFLLNSSLNRINVNNAVLKKGIVSFDQYSQPITCNDIKDINTSKNRLIYGCMGFGLGCIGGMISFIFLSVPFIADYFQTEWDLNAAQIPVIALSLSELAIITKFFIDEGNKRDIKAKIAKIKQQRSYEHRLKQKAGDE